MEPTLAFPPATPFTLQVTALLELPVTIAAYCEEVPERDAGSSIQEHRHTDAPVDVGTATARRVRQQDSCETVGLATLVAVIVTFED